MLAGAAPTGGTTSIGHTSLIAATISSWPTTLAALPLVGRVERHELDEPHLDALVATEAGEVDQLVVVGAAFDDGVDLDRVEAGRPWPR